MPKAQDKRAWAEHVETSLKLLVPPNKYTKYKTKIEKEPGTQVD
jgi:hypothetical protein